VSCHDVASIQIAKYNTKDKQKGAWHHDQSVRHQRWWCRSTPTADKGGATEVHNHGVLNPLPTGHALIFPSFTNLHRGLPVESGDRYLLVFWLYDHGRIVDNAELWSQ